MMTRAARIVQVIETLEEVLGTPKQAPKLPPPLDMLIATVLSQNTNDKNSHRAYTQLRDRYNRWEDVANAPIRSLKSVLKVGGMADQKARRIQGILATVKTRFGGYDLARIRTWSTEKIIGELTTLRGVGPKTAACVCVFSLRRDVFPVDTHVHRLCSRLGLAPRARTPEETFKQMRGALPRGKGYSFHTNLIRFGRRVCRSSNPACDSCRLYGLCVYEKKKPRSIRSRNPKTTANYDFMLLDNVS